MPRALRVLQEQAEAVCARVKSEVASRLGDAGAVAALVDAATRAHAALDEEGHRALARARAPELACTAGCSYCCHVHVDATVPEILAIADHLARAWPREARDALRDRLRRHADSMERTTDEERWAARLPCALLDRTGRCSIYEVRPLRCRAFHSRSATPCREAFEGRDGEGPALDPALERAQDAAEAGYDRALVEAGLSADGHRLEIGLLIALEDPDAGERFRRGEQAFARAHPDRARRRPA